jgi:hypothetical protein
VRSKDVSESANGETTNHGKNDSQLNIPDPPPLKSLDGSRLYNLVVSSTSRHTQELGAPCRRVRSLLSKRDTTCKLNPEMLRKLAPLCKLVPWLLLLHG